MKEHVDKYIFYVCLAFSLCLFIGGFNNVMSASGNYTTGRLEASGDGGSTWGTITSGNEGLTLYITKQ